MHHSSHCWLSSWHGLYNTELIASEGLSRRFFQSTKQTPTATHGSLPRGRDDNAASRRRRGKSCRQRRRLALGLPVRPRRGSSHKAAGPQRRNVLHSNCQPVRCVWRLLWTCSILLIPRNNSTIALGPATQPWIYHGLRASERRQWTITSLRGRQPDASGTRKRRSFLTFSLEAQDSVVTTCHPWLSSLASGCECHNVANDWAGARRALKAGPRAPPMRW